MMMHKFFIISLLLAYTLNAQQGEILNTESKDSVYRYQGINPAMKFYNNTFDFIIPYEFSLSNSNQLADGDSATLWLRTELALTHFSNPTVGIGIKNKDLMMPLHKQYLENSKINPIMYVLGIAQTAAVGYMAYRHIKKYGFFK